MSSSQGLSNKTGIKGGKYRNLIFLASAFLALIVALSILTYVAAGLLTLGTREIETSAQQASTIEQLSKDLFDINLHLQDAIKQHPEASESVSYDVLPQSVIYRIEDIERRYVFFDESLKVLRHGGTLTISSGEQVEFDGIQSTELNKNLDAIEQIWVPYRGLLQNFITESKRGAIQKETSDYLVDYARLYDESMQAEFQKFSVGLNHIIQVSTNRLRIIQIVGILAAFGLFVMFVFGALRQLVRNDRLLEVARRETSDILATVDTGLFLLDKDLNIGRQHSKALVDIIGTGRLAGENLTDVLRNRISETDLETTRQFVEQLYNVRVKEKLVNDLNPLNRVMFYDENKAQNRYLDFKFSRVYEDKEIARILVNVNDVSNAVYLEQRLEKERAQNDMQIEMLATILNVSPKIIDEFIQNTYVHIEKMNNVLKNPGSSQFELENKLKSIYREMHSLKGEASALKLHSFTKIASEAEDKLHALQNQGKLSGNDFLPLTVHLDELLSLSNTIADLGNRINHANMQIHDKAPESAVKTTSHSQQATVESLQSPSQSFANYLVQFGRDIAERQNKQVMVDISSVSDSVIPNNLTTVVKELCVQLLRNAIVHGIEDDVERFDGQKPACGVVSISIQQHQESADEPCLTLVVEDDGKGIDYEAIRNKLVQLGRYDLATAEMLTEAQLLNSLFTSGFSTKSDVDEDGGRGVGLDIVKDRVKEYDGKINVQSEKGKFTRFIVKLPIS